MERDGSGASTLLGLDCFVVQAQLLEEASVASWSLRAEVPRNSSTAASSNEGSSSRR